MTVKRVCGLAVYCDACGVRLTPHFFYPDLNKLEAHDDVDILADQAREKAKWKRVKANDFCEKCGKGLPANTLVKVRSDKKVEE